MRPGGAGMPLYGRRRKEDKSYMSNRTYSAGENSEPKLAAPGPERELLKLLGMPFAGK